MAENHNESLEWKAFQANVTDYINTEMLKHLKWHKNNTVWGAGENAVLFFNQGNAKLMCQATKPALLVSHRRFEAYQANLRNHEPHEFLDVLPAPNQLENDLSDSERSLTPDSTNTSGYASRFGSGSSSSNESPSPPRHAENNQNPDEDGRNSRGNRRNYGSGRFNRAPVFRSLQ